MPGRFRVVKDDSRADHVVVESVENRDLKFRLLRSEVRPIQMP